MQQLMSMIADVTGKPQPKEIPLGIAKLVSRFQTLRYKYLKGSAPKVSSPAIAVISSGQFLDGSKAAAACFPRWNRRRSGEPDRRQITARRHPRFMDRRDPRQIDDLQILIRPEDLGVHRLEAKRTLLAARSMEDLVVWSGELYHPPARFRSW
jgi:hypothetical protein